MKKAVALSLSVFAASLVTALPANANPVVLVAQAIHGFLLAGTAISATLAGPLAIAASQALVAGTLAVPASRGFLMRQGSGK